MVTVPRILVAGCLDTDVDLLRDAVSDLCCDIETVHDGASCLAQLQRFQPHLVLLDTATVDLDAYELCRHIKNDHTALVVIVTALNELGDIGRAVNSGTDDLLSKPINKTEALRRAENLLALHDTLR